MTRKLVILSLTLLIGFLNCQSFDDKNASLEEDILLAVNKLRTKGCTCGKIYMPPVKPLKWNTVLEKAAMRHAKDMAEKHYLDHTGSDGSNIAWRVNDAGYNWSAVGENIAYGYESVEEVMKGWKNSVGHCRNLMKAAYVEMGVARVDDYWAQTLAKPRNR